MGVSSISSAFLTVTGPQVSLVSPQTAIANIRNTVAQLSVTGGVSLAQEGSLEQQLVKQITAANASANQGTIAVIANDLNGATTSTQITNDLNALIRMVQPTTGVTNLTNTINSIGGLLRVQNSGQTTTVTPPAPFNATVAATALTGATTLTLTTASGMTAGDSLEVTLDTGQTFETSIASINNNVITLEAGLPSQVSNGNTVIDLPGIATYQTTLAVNANAGDGTLTLTSAGGLSVGDSLQVLLDNGALFTTQITAINNNVVTIAQTMPGAAGAVHNYVADQTNPFTTVNQNTALGSTQNTITYFTSLSSTAPANQNFVLLNSVAGMSAGDTIQIGLDSGSTFTTTINNVDPVALQVTLAQPLPSSAGTSNNNVSDTIQLFPTAATYTPSSQMTTIFDLQINDLIQAANPTVGLSQLTKDLAALSNPLLTNITFQQALATLNTLWTSTLPSGSGATLSVLA